jgi:hypothetical protein
MQGRDAHSRQPCSPALTSILQALLDHRIFNCSFAELNGPSTTKITDLNPRQTPSLPGHRSGAMYWWG